MESTCFDDGDATHIMIEVMPLEEEKVSHNENSVTSLRPMEVSLDNDPLLSSPLMAAELDSAGCQNISDNYQVVFKSSAPSFQQKKSYKVYLKPMKSPGQRKNFQVIFKALGTAEAGKVAELGHKNTVVCSKSPVGSLVKEKLGERSTVGSHSSARVAAKDLKNNPVLANKLFIQGLHGVQRPNRTASNFSESTPLKLDLKDHSLSWHSSPDLSRAIHESCVTNKGTTKSRTPRTLTRLMQQHRDNERYRHRGLNASINDIIGRLPKRSKKSDHETKIVKLKRIISYICHLENYIRGLCGELGLDLDFRQLFMTPNVKNLQVPKVDGSSCHSDELDYKSDWMSDAEAEESQLDVQEYDKEEAEEEMAERISTSVLSASSVEEELMSAVPFIMDDGLNATGSGQEMGQEEIPEYTILSYDQCDFSHLELEKELEVLEQFIQMSSESAALDYAVNDGSTVSDFSCDDIGRPRVDDVFRTIDINILHSDFPSEGGDRSSSVGSKGPPHGRWDDATVTAEAVAGLLPKAEKLDEDFDENVGQSFFGEEFSLKGDDSMQPEAAVDFIDSNSVTDENKLASSSKGRGAGARRITWMNGFMMYSHLHRQNYLRANSGLRNSHVTKLMANDWRKMDPAEQQPYRDQAKGYVESRLQIAEGSRANY